MTTSERLAASARDIMSSPPITIHQDASLADAADLMLENHASHIVVGRGMEAVGVIARHDLLEVFAGSGN